MKGVVKLQKPNRWQPAVLLKRPDTLGVDTSKYSNTFATDPNKEKEHDMFRLMGNDYAREWHEQHSDYTKHSFETAEKSFFRRKVVIRGLRKKFPAEKTTTLFKMKKFQNVPSRTDNKNTLKENKVAVGKSENQQVHGRDNREIVPNSRSSYAEQPCSCQINKTNEIETVQKENDGYIVQQTENLGTKPAENDGNPNENSPSPNESARSARSCRSVASSIATSKSVTSKARTCEGNMQEISRKPSKGSQCKSSYRSTRGSGDHRIPSRENVA